MTPALYTITLLVGLVLGWQGSLLATGRASSKRRAAQGRGVAELHTPDTPALEIDLTDKPVLFDWRSDPDIAKCVPCRGKGRLWTVDGIGHRCPCGAIPATPRSQAAAR